MRSRSEAATRLGRTTKKRLTRAGWPVVSWRRCPVKRVVPKSRQIVSAVAATLLGLGEAIASWCGRRIVGTGRQWRMLVFLAIGVIFAVVTIVLRWADAGQPVVSDAEPGNTQIGVFTNPDDRAVFEMTPSALSLATGVQIPQYRFSVDIKPGAQAYGRISLVLGDHDLGNLSVDRPLTVLFNLPEGAELTDWQDRGVAVEPPMPHPCASWWNGEDRFAAPASLQRNDFGTTLVTCQVPKVGDVSDLYLDVQFMWHDQLRHSAGFGRVSSSVRISSNLDTSSAMTVADVGLAVADRVELNLLPAAGERLTETFPQPSGGQHNERSWLFDFGGIVDYTIERPRARIWVQPAIDGFLLLAGAMFGIAPTAWRKRPEED